MPQRSESNKRQEDVNVGNAVILAASESSDGPDAITSSNEMNNSEQDPAANSAELPKNLNSARAD